MPEPAEILAAREHLAKAEASYRSANGLHHLEEGLGLLDDVLSGDAPAHQVLARNLASTYAAKIYGSISRRLEMDRAVPEPELEHFFRIVLAFDQVDFALPDMARLTKIAIARRLIDCYYEGHADESRRGAIAALAKIAGADPKCARRRRQSGAARRK